MDRSTRKSGLINLVALVIAGMVGFVAARLAGSLAGQVGMSFVAIGALVAAVSWFQTRLEENERLEKLEYEELTKGKSSASLFETRGAEVFPVQHSREQFERFVVPAITIFLFLAEAAGAYFLWRWARSAGVSELNQPLVWMSVFAVCFLCLFILGRFSSTVARLEDHRLLRPGASSLLLAAYVYLVVAVALASAWSGKPAADGFVAQGLCVLLGLLAAETLITLVLEIYRPRVKGKVGRPLYESRLTGLLAHPEGLFTTAAQALDYQFGFKVSETWAYQMLVEKLPLFVLGLAAATILSSSFVFLEPGQQALIERFGRTRGGLLEPGPHLKWPWPIEQVYRYETGLVHMFNVGFVSDPAFENDPTLLWTVTHTKEEYNLLVASRDLLALQSTNQAGSEQNVPVNLIVAGIPVQYQITNVVAWAYGHSAPEELLQQAATREVVRYFAGVDLLDIMSADRETASRELLGRIQARADELDLGAKILFVGLQDIHPPVSVAQSFEDVVGAAQEVEAVLLRAEGETNLTVLLAKANAISSVRTAEAEALKRVLGAQALASRFTNQMTAYKSSPDVYPNRIYLQTVARATAGTRKYLVAPTNSTQVIQLNLEDQIRPDLLGSLTIQTNR
jgi:regulator of protease activity HflC (stomatin/prohibitin superfamily)